MKFICDQQILSKSLGTVSKAVTSRTTIPILKGILIKASKDGILKLSASDLDISIEKTIFGVNIIEEGSVVVLAKLFTDIIRKLPAEEILIEQIEENNIIIKTSSSEFTISAISPEEFPEVGEVEEEEKLFFEKELFKEMIKKTAFAASVDEAKGIITGILIELEPNRINMVSLDGFRMAVVREETKNEKNKKIIISAKILNDINKIIYDVEGEEDILLALDKKKAVLIIENIKITLRLMEGEFVRYRDILPKDNKCRIKVNKNVLSESMERAALLSKEGKNNLIKFKITDYLLTITSRSEEGNVREEVPAQKWGVDMEIGFNAKYIIDVLKAIDEEDIIIEMMSSVKPCVMKPIENDKFEYIVLPVKIS